VGAINEETERRKVKAGIMSERRNIQEKTL
jgi:hypothetical protein